MGVAYYPVFQDGVDEWTVDIDGKCLAQAGQLVDSVCRKASVEPFGEFCAASANDFIIHVLGGDPDDPSTYDASQVLAETWFDAQRGLETVRVLLEYVRSGSGDIDNRDGVLQDLVGFETALNEAVQRGTGWRLGVDY